MAEYIRFFHKNTSTEIITNTNYSIKNTLDLQINLYLNTQTYLSGYIKQNTNTIGEVYKNSSSENIMWYSGFSELPIKMNDIISVEITDPITITKSFIVNRYQPNIMPIISFGKFLEMTNKYEFLQSNKNNTIDHTLNYINQPKQFQTPKNVLTIKRYFHDLLPLPELQALFFKTTTETNNALTSYTPPTMQEIFDTWDIIVGDEYYTAANRPTSPPGSTWTYDSGLDSVFQSSNSHPPTGFVSLEQLEYYEFEATLRSTSSDDDGNGLIIAFDRNNNVNDYLVVVVNNGGVAPTNGFGISYSYITARNWHINNSGYDFVYKNSTYSGWAASGPKRVKVRRNGNIIDVIASNWNNTTQYNAASALSIDLDSDSRLHKFKGPKPYGYWTYSQPNSYYQDIVLKGGLDRGTIVNAQTSQVYRYNTTTNIWELTILTPQEIFGYERPITNPDTGETFLIREHDILIL